MRKSLRSSDCVCLTASARFLAVHLPIYLLICLWLFASAYVFCCYLSLPISSVALFSLYWCWFYEAPSVSLHFPSYFAVAARLLLACSCCYLLLATRLSVSSCWERLKALLAGPFITRMGCLERVGGNMDAIGAASRRGSRRPYTIVWNCIIHAAARLFLSLLVAPLPLAICT